MSCTAQMAMAVTGTLLGLWTTAAGAHERSASYSSWVFTGGDVTVTLTVAEQDAGLLRLSPSPDSSLMAYAPSRLRLDVDGLACSMVQVPRQQPAPAGRLRITWGLSCPEAGTLRIESALFDDPAAGHVHFATVHEAAGSAQRVLARGDRAWSFRRQGASSTGESSSWQEFILLGVKHIVTGYDHLVFLFALLLCGGSFANLVRLVTGFTVGHSITLALAALGLVRPQAAAIEALIGLSIALVAVENVWLLQRAQRALPAATLTTVAALGLTALSGLGKVTCERRSGSDTIRR